MCDNKIVEHNLTIQCVEREYQNKDGTTRKYYTLYLKCFGISVALKTFEDSKISNELVQSYLTQKYLKGDEK